MVAEVLAVAENVVRQIACQGKGACTTPESILPWSAFLTKRRKNNKGSNESAEDHPKGLAQIFE